VATLFNNAFQQHSPIISVAHTAVSALSGAV
jgi:hypothetical protein